MTMQIGSKPESILTVYYIKEDGKESCCIAFTPKHLPVSNLSSYFEKKHAKVIKVFDKYSTTSFITQMCMHNYGYAITEIIEH